MKEWAKDFYFSPAWRATRAAYIKKVGGLCERCLKRGLLKAGVIVHHKTHISPENITDEKILLCEDNLELLCRDCHADEHIRVKRRYEVDEDGKVTGHGA